MIGMRAVASTVAAVCVAASLGPRLADPAGSIAAERLLRERASTAVQALDALRSAIEPGLDAARHASAAVVAGDEEPAPLLEAAGDDVAAAEGAATAARRAVTSLNGSIDAWRPDLGPVPEPIEAGSLPSIGEQLAAAGPAATGFVDIRQRSSALPATIEEAVAALDAGDLDAAESILARARADHDLVAAWELAPSTMAVWLETTDAIIGAIEGIVAASRAGDLDAAMRAAGEFADLAEESTAADRALRIGLSEGGAAIAAAPLERLATELRQIESVRAQAAGIAAGIEP
jgi:hypothetical protein